eukprot:6119913-Prymnesium_polylepis.1
MAGAARPAARGGGGALLPGDARALRRPRHARRRLRVRAHCGVPAAPSASRRSVSQATLHVPCCARPVARALPPSRARRAPCCARPAARALAPCVGLEVCVGDWRPVRIWQ